MKQENKKTTNWKKIIYSHITGVLCAVGLSAVVSVICKYNFFIVLICFLLAYFILGVLIEYLLGVLYIEKKTAAVVETNPAGKHESKKKTSDKGTDSGLKVAESARAEKPVVPNKNIAKKYANALRLKHGRSSDLSLGASGND